MSGATADFIMANDEDFVGVELLNEETPKEKERAE